MPKIAEEAEPLQERQEDHEENMEEEEEEERGEGEVEFNDNERRDLLNFVCRCTGVFWRRPLTML